MKRTREIFPAATGREGYPIFSLAVYERSPAAPKGSWAGSLTIAGIFAWAVVSYGADRDPQIEPITLGKDGRPHVWDFDALPPDTAMILVPGERAHVVIGKDGEPVVELAAKIVNDWYRAEAVDPTRRSSRRAEWPEPQLPKAPQLARFEDDDDDK